MFKGKKNKIIKESPVGDKVAGKIAGFVITVQTKCSDFMNKLLSRLSLQKTKILLVVFCFCWGSLSIYFILQAVFDSKPTTLKVDPLQFPRHFIDAGDEETTNRVDEHIYQQIQAYRKSMDSLHQPIRPGLLDSMNVLEQIYLLQQKNETNEK